METKIGILILAILAPLTAEILNGSTRLFELTSWNVFAGTILPYSFLIIILAYLAQGALSRASVLFLLPIAGIVIEGLITKSFFNISFSDLSVLGGVGVLGGVQWPWTLSLIASHAFVSFLIPITLAKLLVSDLRVGKGIAYFSAATLATFIVWIATVSPHSFGWYWVKLGALVFTIILLVYFARAVRISKPSGESASLTVFFFVGLLFPLLNWLTSFFLATKPLMIIITAQFIFIFSYIYFLWGQWFNERTSDRKRIVFIAGYYVPFSVGLVLSGVRHISFFLFVGIYLAWGIVALLLFANKKEEPKHD